MELRGKNTNNTLAELKKVLADIESGKCSTDGYSGAIADIKEDIAQLEQQPLSLEQAAQANADAWLIPTKGALKGSFKKGAAWQKEQDNAKFQRLIKLVDSLVYYSQIHTVTGVCPANAESHEKTWKEARKWLLENCENIYGEYLLKNPLNHETDTN